MMLEDIYSRSKLPMLATMMDEAEERPRVCDLAGPTPIEASLDQLNLDWTIELAA
jgi:hypothetical protein